MLRSQKDQQDQHKCCAHQKPFPGLNLLSNYLFEKRFVKIFPNGDIQGGMCRLIASLIDFSFIRSIVAHRYSDKGPPCYDPPSLFLLDLFRHIDDHKDMSRFCEILRDEQRGRSYRMMAGINDHIPCEGTFSNFRARLGKSLYNEIFHVLVDIFHRLEMITLISWLMTAPCILPGHDIKAVLIFVISAPALS
jgi:hypothetical protein